MRAFFSLFLTRLALWLHPQIEVPKLPADPKYTDGRELPHEEEQPQVKFAIIVGHEKKAGGAEMYGTHESEYSFNTKLAKEIANFCTTTFHQLKPIIIYRDGIGISGAYHKASAIDKADLCVELHFNASGGAARGTEVLCTTDKNDLDFAHIMLSQICQALGRTGESRGVKTIPRNGRGGANVHGFPGGANCLIEPFFGDNKQDSELAYAKNRQLAEAVAKAAYLYAKKVDLI